MRIPIPSYETGALILWMWIGVCGVIVTGYMLIRWWRRTQPPRMPESDLAYSKALRERLKARNLGGSRKAKQPKN